MATRFVDEDIFTRFIEGVGLLLTGGFRTEAARAFRGCKRLEMIIERVMKSEEMNGSV